MELSGKPGGSFFILYFKQAMNSMNVDTSKRLTRHGCYDNIYMYILIYGISAFLTKGVQL